MRCSMQVGRMDLVVVRFAKARGGVMSEFQWIPYHGDEYADISIGEGFECRDSHGRSFGFVIKKNGSWWAYEARNSRVGFPIGASLKCANAMKIVEEPFTK